LYGFAKKTAMKTAFDLCEGKFCLFIFVFNGNLLSRSEMRECFLVFVSCSGYGGTTNGEGEIAEMKRSVAVELRED
jgi:hypothetical protein